MTSPAIQRAANGLAGAFMLARGRKDGLALIDPTPAGAWASFASMWLCAPGYVALRLMGAGEEMGDPLRVLLAEAIGYVLGWFAFPVLMAGLVVTMMRVSAFPRFVSAWNWTNAVQILVLLCAGAIGALGILPGAAGDALGIAALLYILWLEWFVAREALAIPGMRAAAVVGADLMLGLFLTGLTLTMAQG